MELNSTYGSRFRSELKILGGKFIQGAQKTIIVKLSTFGVRDEETGQRYCHTDANYIFSKNTVVYNYNYS